MEKRFLKKKLSAVSNAEKRSSQKWLVNLKVDLESEYSFRLQRTRLLRTTEPKTQFQLRSKPGMTK